MSFFADLQLSCGKLGEFFANFWWNSREIVIFWNICWVWKHFRFSSCQKIWNMKWIMEWCSKVGMGGEDVFIYLNKKCVRTIWGWISCIFHFWKSVLYFNSNFKNIIFPRIKLLVPKHTLCEQMDKNKL